MIFSAMLGMALTLGVYAPAYASYGTFSTRKEVPSENLSEFTKWNGMIGRYKEQKASASCTGDQCPAKQWETLMARLRSQSTMTIVEEVNDFFNNVPYIEDSKNWGKRDYWATPYEMMQKGADCEDYAIAKYLALRELGIPEQQMRVVIVNDTNLGIMHAVLEVRIEDNRYLLDNQISSVVNELNAPQYSPIYGINTQQWWAYK